MKRVASPRLAPVAIARGAGGTSRFPQALSTGPLRGRALRASSARPLLRLAGGTCRFPQAPSTGPLRGRALRATPARPRVGR
jgi:hypothetical protein